MNPKQIFRYFQLCALSLALCFCAPKNNEEKHQKLNGTNILEQSQSAIFQKFLKRIPLKQLPLKLTCGINSDLDKSVACDQLSEFDHLFPQNTFRHVWGYYKIKNFYAVIYTWPSVDIIPTVFIYNTKGQKLDSFCLNQGCNADAYVKENMHTYIDTDFNIIQNDTLFNFDFDETNPTKTGKKIIDFNVTQKNYKLTDEGKFIEILKEEKTIKINN